MGLLKGKLSPGNCLGGVVWGKLSRRVVRSQYLMSILLLLHYVVKALLARFLFAVRLFYIWAVPCQNLIF